jgi:outer membrane protein OmpA-like peptidoglycan-associated protein
MPNGADKAAEIRLKAFDSVSEWSKHITTIASATLVLSATFIKDIISGHVVHQGYLSWSWGLLLCSIISSAGVLGSLIACLNKGEPGQLDVYSPSIIITAVSQVVLFGVGMGLFICFVSANLSIAGTTARGVQPPASTKPTLALRLEQAQDAYFDDDKSEIRKDAEVSLTRDAELLKKLFQEFPDATVFVEGHCDDRGTAEYNIVLGYRRARVVRQFLVRFGIPSDKLKAVSCGKEEPQCIDRNEQCRQRNRRVHMSGSG